MPERQEPHCPACSSRKARCSGCGAARVPRPSTVRTGARNRLERQGAGGHGHAVELDHAGAVGLRAAAPSRAVKAEPVAQREGERRVGRQVQGGRPGQVAGQVCVGGEEAGAGTHGGRDRDPAPLPRRRQRRSPRPRGRRSTRPSASRCAFPGLPAVLRGPMKSDGSAAVTAVAKAAPKAGRPPREVEVPRERRTGGEDCPSAAPPGTVAAPDRIRPQRSCTAGALHPVAPRSPGKPGGGLWTPDERGRRERGGERARCQAAGAARARLSPAGSRAPRSSARPCRS